MVTARFLSDKFLKPLHEILREEGRKEGREQGREEMHRQLTAWNQRRLEVKQNGELFHEPLPGSDRIQHKASKE